MNRWSYEFMCRTEKTKMIVLSSKIKNLTDNGLKKGCKAIGVSSA